MLLARLSAEKQEVSCQTLLKLENNSLKVCDLPFKYSKTTTERKITPGQKGASGGEEAKELSPNLRSPKESRPVSCWVIIIIITVFSNVAKSCNGIWKQVEVPDVCLQLTLRATTAFRKTLASSWIASEAGYSPGFTLLHGQQRWQQAQLRF